MAGLDGALGVGGGRRGRLDGMDGSYGRRYRALHRLYARLQSAGDVVRRVLHGAFEFGEDAAGCEASIRISGRSYRIGFIPVRRFALVQSHGAMIQGQSAGDPDV